MLLQQPPRSGKHRRASPGALTSASPVGRCWPLDAWSLASFWRRFRFCDRLNVLEESSEIVPDGQGAAWPSSGIPLGGDTHPRPARKGCRVPRLGSMLSQPRERPEKHCTPTSDAVSYEVVNAANGRWAGRSCCCSLMRHGVGPLPPIVCMRPGVPSPITSGRVLPPSTASPCFWHTRHVMWLHTCIAHL